MNTNLTPNQRRGLWVVAILGMIAGALLIARAVFASGFDPQDYVADATIKQLVSDGTGFVGPFTQGNISISINPSDPKAIDITNGAAKTTLTFKSEVMSVAGNGSASFGYLTRKGLFSFGADGITARNQGTNLLDASLTVYDAYTGQDNSGQCVSVMQDTSHGYTLSGMSVTIANDYLLKLDSNCSTLPQQARAAFVRINAYWAQFLNDFGLTPIPSNTPQPTLTVTPTPGG